MRKKFICGNWKMNGLRASIAEFDAMLAGASKAAGKADLLVCPPATLIAAFAQKSRGFPATVLRGSRLRTLPRKPRHPDLRWWPTCGCSDRSCHPPLPSREPSSKSCNRGGLCMPLEPGHSQRVQYKSTPQGERPSCKSWFFNI